MLGRGRAQSLPWAPFFPQIARTHRASRRKWHGFLTMFSTGDMVFHRRGTLSFFFFLWEGNFSPKVPLPFPPFNGATIERRTGTVSKKRDDGNDGGRVRGDRKGPAWLQSGPFWDRCPPGAIRFDCRCARIPIMVARPKEFEKTRRPGLSQSSNEKVPSSEGSINNK
jgi:hypothetical protein